MKKEQNVDLSDLLRRAGKRIDEISVTERKRHRFLIGNTEDPLDFREIVIQTERETNIEPGLKLDNPVFFIGDTKIDCIGSWTFKNEPLKEE